MRSKIDTHRASSPTGQEIKRVAANKVGFSFGSLPLLLLVAAVKANALYTAGGSHLVGTSRIGDLKRRHSTPGVGTLPLSTFDSNLSRDCCTSDVERRQVFEDNAGFIYLPHFLYFEEALAIIQEAPELIGGATKELDSIAQGRLIASVPEGSITSRVFKGEKLLAEVGSIGGEEEMFPSALPVELRVYPRGSSMGWHSDDVLYARPQYELIYTLENTSDSLTEWKDLTGKCHSVSTEPNSLLVVRAGGPRPHRVTRVNQGRRSVIKAAVTPTEEASPGLKEHLGGLFY
ncbi:unnamed protein product [Choristocarpus tenellus]